MKFEGTPYEDRVLAQKSAMIAARVGRSKKAPRRSDWEDVKNDIMK
jgi:predicted NAD-dependent protein-ADP-ribosyltransferase YbiA (DUF1768 family)